MQWGETKFNMAIFPKPNVTDLQDVERIANWVGVTASGGIFWPVMVLVIWSIAFIGSISEGREAHRAFIFANFISLTLSIPLGLLGWLNVSYIYFLIILLGFGLIWIKLQKRTRF